MPTTDISINKQPHRLHWDQSTHQVTLVRISDGLMKINCKLDTFEQANDKWNELIAKIKEGEI